MKKLTLTLLVTTVLGFADTYKQYLNPEFDQVMIKESIPYIDVISKVSLINDIRSIHGLSRLKVSNAFSNAALTKAYDIFKSNKLQIIGSGGSSDPFIPGVTNYSNRLISYYLNGDYVGKCHLVIRRGPDWKWFGWNIENMPELMDPYIGYIGFGNYKSFDDKLITVVVVGQ